MDYTNMAKEIAAGIPELKGIQLKNLKNIDTVLPLIIKAIEIKSLAEALSSADKRGLTIAIINLYVDIPYVSEEFEALLIGKLVDSNINVLNSLIGKNWIKSAV